MKNVFACLVHERQEVVVDLVRNLAYLVASPWTAASRSCIRPRSR